ncbi:MAG: ABC transporter ATP-binding protein [Gemmatimonadales bacterium]
MVKRFYHYEHRTTSLREVFIRSVLRRPIHVRQAQFTLRDFTLQVDRGESVAMIGSNGSGKSTALRLMAGIYQPSEGNIRTVGRVAAVIELGVGFNPELTGLENAATYAAVLGLTRPEVNSRLPAMVEFADLGEFIEEPVKYYSSGMQARLAFAVAICVDPDILFLDEVLAVGDETFRGRCFDRLHRFRDNGGTLIVVSHDLDTLRGLCTRAIWLEKGQTREAGPVDDVIDHYLAASGTAAVPGAG